MYTDEEIAEWLAESELERRFDQREDPEGLDLTSEEEWAMQDRHEYGWD